MILSFLFYGKIKVIEERQETKTTSKNEEWARNSEAINIVYKEVEMYCLIFNRVILLYNTVTVSLMFFRDLQSYKQKNPYSTLTTILDLNKKCIRNKL